MKRIISVLLVVVMLFGLVPFSNAAKTALGATEANALETVEGSFDYLLKYIYAFGEYDKTNETISAYLLKMYDTFDLSKTYTDVKGKEKLSYNAKSDEIIWTLEFSCNLKMNDNEKEKVDISLNLSINRYTKMYHVENLFSAENYGYFGLKTELNPEEYTSGKSLNWNIDTNNRTFFCGSADNASISKDADEYAEGTIDIFNCMLDGLFGISAGNFGFTKIAEPVKVPEGPVYLIELYDKELQYKDNVNLNVRVLADEGSKYTVEYTSSNPKVATVDQNGNITTTGKGTTDITCKVTDSSGKTIFKTRQVTVKFTFAQWLIWIFLLGFLWY